MIKEAKIISPSKIGQIGLKYLPVYNDRHTLNLTLWGTIDNEYRVNAIFYETNNKFLIVLDLLKSNIQTNSDLKTIVIIGSFQITENILVDTEIKRLPDEFANEFTQLTISFLPRWGEYIIVRKSNAIIVLRCDEVIIKSENKLPLLKLDCCGTYNDEKEILRSHGVANLQWDLAQNLQ